MNNKRNCNCHNCGCKDCDNPSALWEDEWLCDSKCTSCACADHEKSN